VARWSFWLLMKFWPSGWQWQPEYERMILGVYATLGVFLVMASAARGHLLGDLAVLAIVGVAPVPLTPNNVSVASTA